MSAFNPRRFVNPDTLKRVSFENLVRLLQSTADDYLAASGSWGPCRVDLSVDEAHFDYDGLAHILLHPDDDYPNDLADALHHVAELADGDGVGMLQQMMGSALDLTTLGHEPTPADIALHAWLIDRTAVETVLGRQFLDRSKSFESFFGPALRGPPLTKLTEASLRPLVADLQGWYLTNKGSAYVRVIPYERGDAVWFLVRHALPPKREPVVRDGKATTSLERPEKHDIVVYSSATDELAIHATTKGETDLFRRAFGDHLFREPRRFTDAGKYSLAPLAEDGVNSLATDRVEEVESVVLVKLTVTLGPGVVQTITAPDVLQFYSERGWQFPKKPIVATFDVKLKDVKKPRKLTIRPPNIAKYQREGEKDLIDAWLTAQEFIPERKTA